MKKLLLKKALTKSQRRLIWDALHTYNYIESTNKTLLKSELKELEVLLPLFHDTIFK